MGDGARPTITVAWSDPPVDLTPAVTRLVIEDHDRLIDEARVTLADGHSIASNAFAAGQQIEIAMGWDGVNTKVFHGKIVRTDGAGGVSSGGSGGQLTLVVHDPSAELHQPRGPRTFAAGTDLQGIVGQIMRDYPSIPVGGIECEPNPTYQAPHVPHLVDRTDFQFLQDLAAVWGARCFVEVNDDRGQFYFKSIRSLWAAEPLATLSYCQGWGNVRTFRYERVAARAARQLATTAVDPRTGAPTRSQGAEPPPPTPPGGALGSDLAAANPTLASNNDAALSVAAGAVPVTVTTPTELLGLPSDPARAAALVVTDPTMVSGFRGVATVAGHIGLRAKGRCEINGIAPWAEGNWWIKRATHTWLQARDARGRAQATWETELEVTR
ncbi:MAG: hypothetical protein AB7L84_09430 [Acidimicrobiia bacterium]